MGATMGDATGVRCRATRGVRSMVADSSDAGHVHQLESDDWPWELHHGVAGRARPARSRAGWVRPVSRQPRLLAHASGQPVRSGFVDSRGRVAFGTRMSAVGERVLCWAACPLRTFAHGFTDARVAASALSGRMGTWRSWGRPRADATVARRQRGHSLSPAGWAPSALGGRALQPFVEGFRNADAASISAAGWAPWRGACRATQPRGGVSVSVRVFQRHRRSLGLLAAGALGGLCAPPRRGGAPVGMLGTGLSRRGHCRALLAQWVNGLQVCPQPWARSPPQVALPHPSSAVSPTPPPPPHSPKRSRWGDRAGQRCSVSSGLALCAQVHPSPPVRRPQAQIEALYGAAGGGR